jgi:hypothetical protein
LQINKPEFLSHKVLKNPASDKTQLVVTGPGEKREDKGGFKLYNSNILLQTTCIGSDTGAANSHNPSKPKWWWLP